MVHFGIKRFLRSVEVWGVDSNSSSSLHNWPSFHYLFGAQEIHYFVLFDCRIFSFPSFFLLFPEQMLLPSAAVPAPTHLQFGFPFISIFSRKKLVFVDICISFLYYSNIPVVCSQQQLKSSYNCLWLWRKFSMHTGYNLLGTQTCVFAICYHQRTGTSNFHSLLPCACNTRAFTLFSRHKSRAGKLKSAFIHPSIQFCSFIFFPWLSSSSLPKMVFVPPFSPSTIPKSH